MRTAAARTSGSLLVLKGERRSEYRCHYRQGIQGSGFRRSGGLNLATIMRDLGLREKVEWGNEFRCHCRGSYRNYCRDPLAHSLKHHSTYGSRVINVRQTY